MSDLLQKNSRVLLTGATGFLGSYILDLLCKNNYQVTALKRGTSDTSLFDHQKINWVEADLLDQSILEETLEKIDVVIHAAGFVSFHARDTKQLFRVNVEGTALLVNLCLQKKIRKFVHVSSVAALGNHPDELSVNEMHFGPEEKFSTRYGLSKYLGEMEVWRAMAEGLNAVILNPSIILGAGDWNRSSARLFKIVKEGLKFYPDGYTGFVDVRDVAIIAVRLMESDITEERFIVSAENMAYRDLLMKMASALGAKLPSTRAGKRLATLAMMADQIRSFITGKEAALTRETVQNSYAHTQFDHSKIKEALDYQFIPIQSTIEACANLLKSGQAMSLLTW